MLEARVIFWRIKRRHIPWAIMRMGWDRLRLRREGVDFWKLLGTGSGETFTVRDANPYRWGVIMVGEDLPRLSHWERRAIASKEFSLKPIAVNGRWAKRDPFESMVKVDAKTWDGKVAAITRARIKWRHNRKFWRSVPPVNIALHASPGLESAIGIGEAPIGLQGTFSLWDSPQAIRDFAYRSPAHHGAIEATKRIGWYSEEMFARFAVVEESGDW